MKALSTFLWVVVLLFAANALLFMMRGIDGIINYGGLVRMQWMFKIATYLSIGVMLWYVFQIKRTLGRGVGVEVIRRLNSLCGVGFLAVLFNSVANASLETQKELGTSSSASITEVKRRILFLSVEQLLDNHMLVYTLLLSLFFLAGYVKLAICLKSENESII